MSSVLYDELGPRGRRRVRIASAGAYVLLGLLGLLAIRSLESHGQFEGRRWENLLNSDLLEFLYKGLWANVRAAVLGMSLALVLATFLALGRLSRAWPLRLVAGFVIETFRALPQLLFILGAALVLPKYGYELPLFLYVVIGLTLYQGAVIAEIFRAGILSLDRGQSEAAYAVGLSYRQTMAFVVVPQAVRRMLPAIVSQLVTLFKDTSLGYAIAYEEMVRRGRLASTQFGESLLQITLLVAVTFIVINALLSRTARRLEARQQRRYGGGATTVTGVEDLATLETT
jgi:glutamate transport system permease protein